MGAGVSRRVQPFSSDAKSSSRGASGSGVGKASSPDASERILFDVKAADIALRIHATQWGRCAWEDKSSQGDRNWLVRIRDDLDGDSVLSADWSRLCNGDDVEKKTSTGHAKGITLQLLQLLREFVSSGAGGLGPATQCARIVRRLVLTVKNGVQDNKGVQSTAIAKMGEHKEAWKVVIKEIRKQSTGLTKTHRKGIPLPHFTSVLDQIEIIVCAISDPDFEKKAVIAGV